MRSRRTPERWTRWQERCGYAPILNECIWIHAVSLGETLAAIPLIKKIIATYPHTPIVVTNMTLTGSEQVTRQLHNTVYNVYIPFDVSHFVVRFLNRTRPRIAIILETELWPNLFKYCQKRNIPIMLTNARLSAASARAYERFFCFNGTFHAGLCNTPCLPVTTGWRTFCTLRFSARKITHHWERQI
ncbi:MAG: hypothetical protein LRY69_05980 [Gammaproteobacteria bacterium]|nr:hypothetical protein [Gammaproteobacteria bacterium]